MAERKVLDSLVDGENNQLWGFVQDAVIDGPLNTGNSEVVRSTTNMQVQKLSTSELRAVAKIQLPTQPDGAGEILSIRFAFSAQILLTNSISTTLTFTNNTSPTKDTIARASGDWGSDGVVDGCQIVVTGTASNNGTYTVDSHTPLVLTIVEDALANEVVSGTVDIYAPPDRDIYLAKGDYGDWNRDASSWDHRLQGSVTNGLAEWKGEGADSSGPGAPANPGTASEKYNDVYINRVKASDLLSINTANDVQRSKFYIAAYGEYTWGERFDIMLHSEEASSNQGTLDLGSADNPLDFEILPSVIVDYAVDGNSTDVDFLSGDFALAISDEPDKDGVPIYVAPIKNEGEDRLIANIFGRYATSSISDRLSRVGIDNQVFRDYIAANSIVGAENVLVTAVRNVLDNALTYDVILKGYQRDGTAVTDTISFTNGGSDSIFSSTPFFYLYHIEIDAASDTDIPNFLDIEVNGVKIANIPDGSNGVVFTAVDSSRGSNMDINTLGETDAVPAIDTTNYIHHFNIWRQFTGSAGELVVNRPNPIEVDMRFWSVVTRAPREIPKGTPSSTGSTGEVMYLKITNPTGTFAVGTSITHIDISLFEDDDGNKVYRRLPLNRATTVAGVNEIEFIYTQDGVFENKFRMVDANSAFATAWLDYDIALNATINAGDPTALVEVYPRVTRIGKEVSIDGRLSGTRAGNVTITDFSSRAWAQDFSGDSGSTADPSTTHPNSGLSPIRKHTYLKSEIGETLPKVVRVELTVTDSNANTATDETEILVNDNDPIDLYVAMRSEFPTISRITAVPDTQNRAFTRLKAGSDGDALVDQGAAGVMASVSGTVAGSDYGVFLERLRQYQRDQTFISVPVFERREDGLSRRLRGVLTGGLETPHEGGDQRVNWVAEMFVEDATLADDDGLALITLKCGDALPGVGLFDMTDDDGVTPLTIGDIVEVREVVGGGLHSTYAIGDGGTAAGQFDFTASLTAGTEYFLRVYNDSTITVGVTKYGDTESFKPLRPGTINIRGVSTETVTT